MPLRLGRKPREDMAVSQRLGWRLPGPRREGGPGSRCLVPDGLHLPGTGRVRQFADDGDAPGEGYGGQQLRPGR